ncbi:hypothetical protein ACLOJK_014903, partial [Asimina triloba]
VVHHVTRLIQGPLHSLHSPPAAGRASHLRLSSPRPLPSASTPTCQHAATATASPAPTADVAAHALATASARCPHPPPSSMSSTPPLNGHDCLARVGSKAPPAYH